MTTRQRAAAMATLKRLLARREAVDAVIARLTNAAVDVGIRQTMPR